MTVLIDIVLVIAWCFAVYVCVFDWEDVRENERIGAIMRKSRK